MNFYSNLNKLKIKFHSFIIINSKVLKFIVKNIEIFFQFEIRFKIIDKHNFIKNE